MQKNSVHGLGGAQGQSTDRRPWVPPGGMGRREEGEEGQEEEGEAELLSSLSPSLGGKATRQAQGAGTEVPTLVAPSPDP